MRVANLAAAEEHCCPFSSTTTAWRAATVHEAHLFGLLAPFRMVGLLITEMRQAPSILG